MNYDVRLSGKKDMDQTPRRIGALAAIIALVALCGALALASPYVRAPGLAAPEPVQSPVALAAPAQPAEESPGYPRECTPPLSDAGIECVFH